MTEKESLNLEDLVEAHYQLDREIDTAYKNYVDDLTLKQMKQEKLLLKTKIARARDEVF